MRAIWGILNWLMREAKDGEKEATDTTTNTTTTVGGEDVVME